MAWYTNLINFIVMDKISRRLYRLFLFGILIWMSITIWRVANGSHVKIFSMEWNIPKDSTANELKKIQNSQVAENGSTITTNTTNGNESPIMTGKGDYKPIRTTNNIAENKTDAFIVYGNSLVKTVKSGDVLVLNASIRNKGELSATHLNAKGEVCYLSKEGLYLVKGNVGKITDATLPGGEEVLMTGYAKPAPNYDEMPVEIFIRVDGDYISKGKRMNFIIWYYYNKIGSNWILASDADSLNRAYKNFKNALK